MREWLAVLAFAFLFGTATESLAQNFNDLLNRLPDIAQSARTRFVESEWKKLPPTELACISGKLHERGDSIESLSRRAILPSDARVADIRSQCVVPTETKPAVPTETKPAVVQPQLGTVPESEVTELRQTVEALKANLADSAAKVAQLVKEKSEADDALKQAERERVDADNARHEIEQMEAAQKAAFSLITQLETDKALLGAKAHTWQRVAIGAIVALVVCLLAWTFTRLRRSRTAATEAKRISEAHLDETTGQQVI